MSKKAIDGYTADSMGEAVGLSLMDLLRIIGPVNESEVQPTIDELLILLNKYPKNLGLYAMVSTISVHVARSITSSDTEAVVTSG